jgi:SAM-dependent methyltransferase
VPQGRARCLDIGWGDMTPPRPCKSASRTDWRCIDVHGLPVGFREDARWSKYRQFDGRRIPHADGEFDVALLCDVLHHAPEDAAELLAEAGRVAKHVLVKDHFEYGTYSRTMLRLRLRRNWLRRQCAGTLLTREGPRSREGATPRHHGARLRARSL